MARRLPYCAWCGKSLAHSARMLIEFEFPGKPTIGWHIKSCDRQDPEFPKGAICFAGALVNLVEQRGRERVVKLRRDPYSPRWVYS